MSGYTFMPPPVLTGAAQEQIRQLSSYLYRMNENLNVALNSLSTENFTESARQTLGSGAGGVTQEILQSQYDALVSMIRAVEKANAILKEELENDIEAATNELAPDSVVTQGGTKAVSGAAVYSFTAQTVAQSGTTPVSGAAVYAYTAQTVAADGMAPVSGAAVAAYVAAEIAKLGS